MKKLVFETITADANKQLLLGTLHLMDSRVAPEWRFCMAEAGSDGSFVKNKFALQTLCVL